MPVLSENKQAQERLDSLIAGCFTLQRLYGKSPESAENMATITNLFHGMLSKFPANQVLLAFEIWMQRSQQFPTPADIISIIKRRGKPPLKESDIIAIRKKNGEDRTRAEWKTLEEWEEQQNESHSEFEESGEKYRLLFEQARKESHELKAEIRRLNELVRGLRAAKGLEPPKQTTQDKINKTIQFMRESGAPEQDIEEFLAGSKYLDLQQATA